MLRLRHWKVSIVSKAVVNGVVMSKVGISIIVLAPKKHGQGPLLASMEISFKNFKLV